MKKIFLLILFLLCLFSVLNLQTPVARSQKRDINATVDFPNITPPDLSKGECSLCDKDFQYLGDKGCCKLDVDIKGTDINSIKYRCVQPRIITCDKDSYCLGGTGCKKYDAVGSFLAVGLCKKFTDPTEIEKCTSCMEDSMHVWTGLGCMPTEVSLIISQKLYPVFLGIGGGASFLIFLYGSFLILTSTGDVEKLKTGKKYIHSSIKGILILIFAVFILRLITVSVLRIPGFS